MTAVFSSASKAVPGDLAGKKRKGAWATYYYNPMVVFFR